MNFLVLISVIRDIRGKTAFADPGEPLNHAVYLLATGVVEMLFQTRRPRRER